MRMRFSEKVVVVTGGARGIGLATAMQAAREGAFVLVSDLDREAVDAAVLGIKNAGGKANGVVGNVAVLSDVKCNVDEIMQLHGRIDVLVNNAGKMTYRPALQLSEEDWRSELDICLGGSFFWAQAVAVASMVPRREGAIVNIGSGAALAALPNSVSYVAAKHGVIGMTKALAVDWGQYNIRVNCVCPGFTWTELTKTIARDNSEMVKQRIGRIPLQRAAQADDIANAILFLASADACTISGQSLAIDGGTLALSSGYSAPRSADA
jgi:NAD(P)-dependent dehydrogenase (short-subunit alcohol dehydrogenase family)